MKSHLLTLCFAASLLAVTGIIMAAPMTAPVRSIEIPAAHGPIVMDGVADAGYSAEQATVAFNVTGSTGADADFTGTFKVCYTAERLYICCTILDDYACEIPYTTSPNPWTWDNAEVFLSLDTVGTTVAYDTNTIQLRFNRGIIDSAQTPGRADQSEYAGNVYYENTASGWILEVGIPWTAVLSDAQELEDVCSYCGAVHGFDVHFGDNDTDGPDARDCQTAWDSDDPEMPDATEDLAWNNRTMFGIMTIDGFGCCSLPPWGMNPESIQTAINIYPNPSGTTIQISNLLPNSNIAIYNLQGIKLMDFVHINTGDDIDVSSLRKGLYFVQVNNSFDLVKMILE